MLAIAKTRKSSYLFVKLNYVLILLIANVFGLELFIELICFSISSLNILFLYEV